MTSCTVYFKVVHSSIIVCTICPTCNLVAHPIMDVVVQPLNFVQISKFFYIFPCNSCSVSIY